MVAKVRYPPYVFNFYGGTHKAIKGNHIFFVNDPEHIGSTFEFIAPDVRKTVYTMISGRMTPSQRNIVKNRCEVNVEEYKNVLNWLIPNHPSYKDMTGPQDSPQPTIIGRFHETNKNCDEEEEPEIKNNIELTVFRFASRNQPTNNTGP